MSVPKILAARVRDAVRNYAHEIEYLAGGWDSQRDRELASERASESKREMDAALDELVRTATSGDAAVKAQTAELVRLRSDRNATRAELARVLRYIGAEDADEAIEEHKRLANDAINHETLIKLHNEQAAELARVTDRITTIADEANGPHPVQSADDAMSCIERALFDERVRATSAEQRLADYERVVGAARDYLRLHEDAARCEHVPEEAWVDAEDSLRTALAALDGKEGR